MKTHVRFNEPKHKNKEKQRAKKHYVWFEKHAKAEQNYCCTNWQASIQLITENQFELVKNENEEKSIFSSVSIRNLIVDECAVVSHWIQSKNIKMKKQIVIWYRISIVD